MERYTRLYLMENQLYSEGAPVIISAGAILKDNETGNFLAQLKFQSVSEKKIKCLSVELKLFDYANRELNENIEFSYLDLDIKRGTFFGDENAIVLKNGNARKFKAKVNEVIFDDGSVWSGKGSTWEIFPSQETLESWLGNGKLEKHYRKQYGNAAKIKPIEYKDLWICTCGTINFSNEEKCHYCKNCRQDVFSVELDKLKEETDAKESKKKKYIFRTVIACVALVIVVMFVLAVHEGVSSTNSTDTMKSFNKSKIKSEKVHKLEFQYPQGEDWESNLTYDGLEILYRTEEDGECDLAIEIRYWGKFKDVSACIKKYGPEVCKDSDNESTDVISMPEADEVKMFDLVSENVEDKTEIPLKCIYMRFGKDVYEISVYIFNEKNYNEEVVEKIIKSYSEKIK